MTADLDDAAPFTVSGKTAVITGAGSGTQVATWGATYI